MRLTRLSAGALMATSALCGVARAQSYPTLVPYTTIQPGQMMGLFKSKLDVNNGVAVNLTDTGGTFTGISIMGTSTAPTPSSTSGSTAIATKGYVDSMAASGGGKAQPCTIANTGAATAMAFSSQAEVSCYNLTLSQANPTLTMTGGVAGTYQRIVVLVSEPSTSSYAWALPTSTSGSVVTLGNVTPITSAGGVTQFSASTYDGGAHIYITGGSSSTSAPTTTSATTLALDTPAQTTPNTPITLTGTYVGTPMAIDYNFGSGWVQAQAPVFANGVFTFTVAAGVPAGSYTPQVRDHYTTAVIGTAGQFVSNAWTPTTLASSPGAAAVWEFNANNPTIAAASATSTVAAVTNSLNASQTLPAQLGTAGNAVLIAHSAGSDSRRRLLQFHPTSISSNTYDPAANWLGAGGVSGSAGAALVNLANSPNVSSSGSFTTVIAMKIDTAYTYAAGPIWGSPLTPGPLQYTQIRANMGNGQVGGQVVDASGTGFSAQTTITAGWHVMTMIKNGATLTFREDGQPVTSVVDTSTGAFTATDFMIGGGFPATNGSENGAPPPFVGEFQAYSGVLAGTDLANAEMLAGNSIGLTLNPTVPTPVTTATTIAVAAPSNVTTGSVYTVSGTYTGGTPVALDVSVDGAAYVPVSSPTISGGSYSFVLSALSTTGSHTVQVRDHNAPSVASQSTAFTVSAPAATGVTALAFGTSSNSCVFGQACAFSGTYTGSNAASFQYQVDSTGWVTPAGATYTGGQWSFVLPSGNTVAAGSHTMSVRDATNTAASAQITFTVSAPATTATSATALSLDTPAQTMPSTAFNITGTFSGGQTAAIDWSTDGATWTAASAPTIASGTAGTFSFNVPGGIATAGTYTLMVRDHNAPTVTASSGKFVVDPFNPNALGTSTGASFVWGFDANNQSLVPASSTGAVSQVFNEKTGSTSQYLAAKTGSSTAAPVAATRLSGSDGLHRALAFVPVPNSDTTFSNGDPTVNWLDANGANGPAGPALVSLANSTNETNNGAFTAIVAARVDTTFQYEAFMGWGAPASPGPLQYIQIRYNRGNGLMGAGMNDSAQKGIGANHGTSTVWQVMTMIKDATGLLTYRENGHVVATATATSTASLTASDFVLGGGFPTSTSTNPGQTFGAPPPYVSSFQAYSGTLSAADLAAAEHMVGSAAGITW